MSQARGLAAEQQRKQSAPRDIVGGAQAAQARVSAPLGTSLIQRSLSDIRGASPRDILQLQRMIGNRAVASLIAGQRKSTQGEVGRGSKVQRSIDQGVIQRTPEGDITPVSQVQAAPQRGVIQRAISIGTEHLPRDLDEDKLKAHFDANQIQQILKLHAERDTIYMFENVQHFINYFTSSGGFPPLVQKISPQELQSGHEMAQMWRFGSIYQPSVNQLPSHAPGAHNIPQQELPPSGDSHMWARTTQSTQQQFSMWSNKLQPPTYPTQFHTFGNPNNPSIWSSQGTFNMGGRVQPTTAPYLVNVDRSNTTYGYLQTETGYVRGHPANLKQQQKSTDPMSTATFDNSPLTYTRESDGTKGGFSTPRYNMIENPAQQTMQPFNQVNISSNPQHVTQMGISPVDRIKISAKQPNNTYQQLDFDNTYNYRPDYDTSGSTDPYQTWLKQHVTTNNFPYEEVYQPKQDFMPADRHSLPGYMSPPPTPFLTPQLRDESNAVVLNGRHLENEFVLHNGDAWIIVTADYNQGTDKTTCKLEKAFTSNNMSFMK